MTLPGEHDWDLLARRLWRSYAALQDARQLVEARKGMEGWESDLFMLEVELQRLVADANARRRTPTERPLRLV